MKQETFSATSGFNFRSFLTSSNFSLTLDGTSTGILCLEINQDRLCTSKKECEQDLQVLVELIEVVSFPFLELSIGQVFSKDASSNGNCSSPG